MCKIYLFKGCTENWTLEIYGNESCKWGDCVKKNKKGVGNGWRLNDAFKYVEKGRMMNIKCLTLKAIWAEIFNCGYAWVNWRSPQKKKKSHPVLNWNLDFYICV